MTAFKKEQMFPASKLRTLSQRELFKALETQGKLGILFRDNLAAVMLPHAKYVELINRLEMLEQERLSMDNAEKTTSLSEESSKKQDRDFRIG